MSILLVLFMFLLVISITYFVKRPEAQPALAPLPAPERTASFDTPKGYCFHPGHTWAFDDGPQGVRVGVDAFAARLLGQVDRIEAIGLNRWVRQGQKLFAVT